MANIVEQGSALFEQLAYATPHPNTQQFLSQQVHNVSHVLTEAGARFFQGATALYERVSGSHAARLARAATRAVASIWQSDEIQAIVTVGRMQHAPLKMQRWIMAEPNTRKLYHQQRCDGYSGTYVDMHPQDIGEDHYDYRRVMDGIIQEREDGSWFASCYLDDLLPEDVALELDQQVDILETWGAQVRMLRKGREDFTDKFGGDL